jgi:hypothetical protein
VAACACGCRQKVKFGRGYLNSRGVELKVVSGFGFLVEQKLAMRPIPNTPPEELDRVRNLLKGLSIMCLTYSGTIHDYSLGLVSESSASSVLNNRQRVFNDETALIEAICYSAAFCLFNGSLSESEFRSEVGKLSSGQRTKAQVSMRFVRQMASEDERRQLPQL